MRFTSFVLLLGFLTSCTAASIQAADWPQFRGNNSSGVAVGQGKLPTEIGPEKNVVWKTKLPPGHSSPVVVGQSIYVTAVDGKKLLTIALDRTRGKIRWQREAPHKDLEKIHTIGSHAQPSPASDGRKVVSFFGSSGMFCYDADGKQLWHKAMGPFNNDFGAGTSPVIVDGRVILCQDHDTDSFLMSIDLASGKTIWKTDRSEFPRNYCSPIIWQVDGKKQIVVAATLRVIGYDFQTGKELWTVRNISRAVCVTPVIGADGNLYVAGWANGGDSDARIRVEPFDKRIVELDKNKNGTLENDELPKGGDIQRRFNQVDRDKTGSVTRAEYEYFRGLFDKGRNVVLSIKPGGRGDVTASHVRWAYTRFVPFCASPLHYQNLVFTVKDGGILSCLDAKTGKAQKQRRLPATGNYYASPVGGDGKVYLLNQNGQVTVVSAAGKWQVLSTADFGEDVYATPALVDGRIYLRTVRHLYCFAEGGGK